MRWLARRAILLLAPLPAGCVLPPADPTPPLPRSLPPELTRGTAVRPAAGARSGVVPAAALSSRFLPITGISCWSPALSRDWRPLITHGLFVSHRGFGNSPA